MKKITQLHELEQLGDDLNRVAEIDKKASFKFHELNPYPEMGVFENLLSTLFKKDNSKIANWGSEQRSFRMAARFASFPQRIEVSPAITLFMYSAFHEDKEKLETINFDDANDAAQILFKTPLSIAIALLFPNPHSVTNLAIDGTKAAIAFAKILRNDRQLMRIIDSRNKIVTNVLGNYRLSQQGTIYLLELQEFEDHSRTVSTGCTFDVISWQEVPNAGIDASVDPRKLPTVADLPFHLP